MHCNDRYSDHHNQSLGLTHHAGCALAAGSARRPQGYLLSYDAEAVSHHALPDFDPFFYPKGDVVLIDFAFIHITLDGIVYAIAQCLRIAVAITGCLYFVMVTEIIDLSNALGMSLQRIGIGYTVPFMLTTAFKFLPEFLSNFNTIKESFLTRAFELDKGNIFQRMKNFIPLFIPLIDSSLDKSVNVASAMQLRAFGAKKKRSFYVKYSFGVLDALLILLCIGLIVFAVWAQKIRLGGFDLHL